MAEARVNYSEDLIYGIEWTDDGEEMLHFSARDVTVDGIRTARPMPYNTGLMFSLKDSSNYHTVPYIYVADRQVNEQHWLKEGHVVYVGQRCFMCDNQLIEE